MKHLKVTTGILSIAFIALTITSCKENKKDHDNDDKHQTEMKDDDHSKMDHEDKEMSEKKEKRTIETTAQKNAATTPIIEAYIQIKNGLVADNKEGAAKGATALLTAFSKFDMTKLSGEAHKNYMEIAESAKEQAEHIVKSPIDHQREHFETLNTDINDLISLLGTEKTLYQDICPMKKASWLSETKDVKNPYYGSKMLTCGFVKKQIN
ncbi:hypothetical protein KCTC32516_00599 [Polaribacter huanghezhanensis]|uniref:DUF3347 domain-containing protein n=1 Tax=Polaribacter huanghezhanensis TaxID=1354726 RepID=UPI0026492D85|nr:DUF3347 domain-containing protein [Polaribacter huanghezhanensis]WKD85259.1 hypothetical protein KCTC32516_00599 [Polaribacter huanghezhanensis]